MERGRIMNGRIKELRKVLDLTQQEFADRIGMKRNTVANYETNRNEPSNSVVSLICRQFNVNENWLRTGEGDMFIKMDRADVLMQWAGSVLRDEDESFKIRFINMLMNMTEDEWSLLDNKALELFTETKKD